MWGKILDLKLKSSQWGASRYFHYWIWAFTGLFLLLWALTLATPKSERRLYSDQATYVMQAGSVWNDGDLKYSLADLKRFRDDYPKETGPEGLFLKIDRDSALHYAKPYIYGSVAAPFYGILGVDGFIVLNVICLTAIGVIIGRALTGAFGRNWGGILSLAFVLPSAFLPWVFVAHPDLFIAALLSLGVYLLLDEKIARNFHFLAAAILGVAVHEKIPFALIVPFVVLAIPSATFMRRTLIGLVAFSVWFLFSGLNVAIDGSLSAYQGLRFHVQGAPYPLEKGWIPPVQGVTEHVFDPLGVISVVMGNIPILRDKFVDFLVGRQTGLLPYFPVAFGLLVFRPAFKLERQVLVIFGLVAYLALLWLAFPTNGYGGTGSYGSRYLMQVLPLVSLAYVGIRSKLRQGAWSINLRTVKVSLLALALIAVLIQHRIFIYGNELVMRFYLSNISPPLNAFRLERWLLPTTFLGASSQYVDSTVDDQFRIYKIQQADKGSWLTIGGKASSISFVAYKQRAEAEYPPLALQLRVRSKIKILNGDDVLWSAELPAGQPHLLDIQKFVQFRTAFDLFLQRRVAYADVVVAAEPLHQDVALSRAPVAWIGFPAISPIFYKYGQTLSVAELVEAGVVLRSGWSHLESWGVWTDGDLADISVKVGSGGRKYAVVLSGEGFVPSSGGTFEVVVYCSGGSSRHLRFHEFQHAQIQFDCEKSPEQDHLLITVSIMNPTSPSAVGRGPDPRRLGLALKTLRIERLD